MADAITMFLQAGRHLEFVGQNVLAEPMRIAAAGSFLGSAVRRPALRPSGAGTGKQNNENAETPNHVRFLVNAAQKNRAGPINIQRNRAALRLEVKL
ncbi:MAG: hypothetical protein WB677_14385 [Xanthobacteraceae bacterium]